MEPPVILVSDDDPLVVNSFSRQATRAGMWVVPDTTSRAPELARVVEPTVIILDVNQAVDGLTLLEELKRAPETRDCVVVMCTSHGDPELRDRALALGAEEFTLKPVYSQFILALAKRAGEIARERLERQTRAAAELATP